GCPIGRRRTVSDPRHWSALRTQSDTKQVPSIPGPLARAGGFFTSQAAPVFENSAACVYVETSAVLRCRRGHEQTCHALSRADFEHKLKVKRLPASSRQSFFTESLILAQDERWRRA